MASCLPNQAQTDNKLNTFSAAVKLWMGKKKMKQRDLVAKSALSATTISRICRNSNDKNGIYTPTIDIVMAVSVGLSLTRAEATDLMFTAFPGMAVWGEILDKRLDIDRANAMLESKNLPILGNVEKE